MSGEFLNLVSDICVIVTIGYISHRMFNSMINYLCKPRDLTPEEIEQIKLNVEKECHERELRITAEVEAELDQLLHR